MKKTIILMFIFLIGCDSKKEYIELKMPAQNPVRYEFDFSINEIHHAIRKAKKNYVGVSLSFVGDSDITWGKEILKDPVNSNDAFIWKFNYDSSYIYYNKNEKIEYKYSAHLHLTPIAEKRTQVEVRTLDREIFIGVRFPYNIITFLKSASAPKFRSVPSSTIEEYKLLLDIGETLGVKEKMPPLILPELPKDEGQKR